MIKVTRTFLAPFIMLFVMACDSADVGKLMEQYMWQKRVLLIFTPTFDHPDYTTQLKTVRDSLATFKEHDIVLWTLEHNSRISVDQEHKPQLPTAPFYRYFKVEEGAFTVVLLGKDGSEQLRRTQAISKEELLQAIEDMQEHMAAKFSNNPHHANDVRLSHGDLQSIKSPTQEQLSKSIQDVLTMKEEFVVLSQGEWFMQMTDQVLEHKTSKETVHRLNVTQLTAPIALELFKHFLKHPTTLHKSYQWKDVSDVLK